ncbi:MAG: exo-alpha-sialidase [Cyclobacteriaceae bacterium]
MTRSSFLFVTLIVVASCKQPGSPSVNTMPSPAGTNSAEPHLFTSTSNEVYLSWVEKHDDKHVFQFSKLKDGNWSDAKSIAEGNNWFVNWADYPMVASDGNGNMIAHVLAKSGEGTFAYDVQMYTSANDGKAWGNPFVIHDDGKQAEHGFVTIIPYQGKMFVTWLDGRNTVKEGKEMTGDHSGHYGAMSLRAAIVDYAGNKIEEWELDNKTCDCCQTTAAITENGPVVIYRDRSDEEIRDMSIVRLVNKEWTQPKAIHQDGWKIAACPVNGPRAASIGDNLGIAWYSAPDGKPQVNFVFSKDGGKHFGDPIRVDEGSPLGRVDIVMIDEGHSLVSWMENAEIRVARISHQGKKERSIAVASSSTARASGFPQMTKAGDKIIFAWTDDAEKTIKVASLTL